LEESVERNTWSDLVVEHRSSPRRIEPQLFRDWIAEQHIFISSVMDSEMAPARQAVRRCILDLGGNPVMWEMLAPRDQHPERAYLEGIERSSLFVLLLGHAYGVSDETGFSPTHKEANRAESLHLYKMVFQPEGIDSSKRDGRLNNWVRSLYNQVSAGIYSSSGDLTDQLERQLNELASVQETVWVKLGNLIFPGKVQSQSAGGRTMVTITARVRQHAVRRRCAELSAQPPRSQTLTWGIQSYPVDLDDVRVESRNASEDDVTIICRPQTGFGTSNRWPLGGVTLTGSGRTYTPADQARFWADRTLFGETHQPIDDELIRRLVMGDDITLPDVLRGLGASGWFAEGVVRLFIVEEMVSRFSVDFEHLRVGLASASGVRAAFTIALAHQPHEPISMSGVVPLS
jgi:hypothetical protein